MSVSFLSPIRGHTFTGTSPGLTSALLSRRRAAESAASSSSRTQDLMLPPSLRSRKRPAGHLARRRPIPRLHRASSRCRVLASCARHALLNIPKCVTAYKRRLSKCLLTVTHTQARRLTLSILLFWKLTRGDVKGTVGQVRNIDCYDTRRLQPLSSFYICLQSKRESQWALP